MHQNIGPRITDFGASYNLVGEYRGKLISKLKNPKMEGRIMNDDKENHDECKMTQTDSEGNTNLCCCYILDQDGQYEDPCYLSVDDCCVLLTDVTDK